MKCAFASVGSRRISTASEPAALSGVCAKSNSWNNGNARHWASVNLGDPVRRKINIDFSVRVCCLCCTLALPAVYRLTCRLSCLTCRCCLSCFASRYSVFSAIACDYFFSFSVCLFFLSLMFFYLSCFYFFDILLVLCPNDLLVCLRISLNPYLPMFGKCLESVWEVFGKCLGSVWEVFGKCLGEY